MLLYALILGLAMAVAVYLAHRILLRPSAKTGPRFWALVDYSWLAIAVFGFALAAIEVDRVAEQGRLASLRQSYDTEFRSIRQGVQATSQLMGPGSSQNVVARWYRFLSTILDLGPSNQKWQHFLWQNEDLWKPIQSSKESRVPQFPSDEWDRLIAGQPGSDTAKDVLLRLSALESNYGDLERKEAALPQEQASRLLRIVLLMLFVPAFAARVTKVTYDLRKVQAKNAT